MTVELADQLEVPGLVLAEARSVVGATTHGLEGAVLPRSIASMPAGAIALAPLPQGAASTATDEQFAVLPSARSRARIHLAALELPLAVPGRQAVTVGVAGAVEHQQVTAVLLR